MMDAPATQLEPSAAAGNSEDPFFTAEQLQLAQRIDAWMRQLEVATIDERLMTVAGIWEYMPLLRRLMHILPTDALDELCRRFPGLFRFAKQLENVGRVVQEDRRRWLMRKAVPDNGPRNCQNGADNGPLFTAHGLDS
jgi:hypothetical protein